MSHLTSFIMEPGGHLPYERDRLRDAFAQMPVAELVPQLFYQLVDAERDRAADGTAR